MIEKMSKRSVEEWEEIVTGGVIKAPVKKEEPCWMCHGTGQIEAFTFDDASKQYISDGMKPCLCQISKQEHEHDDF